MDPASSRVEIVSILEEADQEVFPANDPPAWTRTTTR
jgi:hypothetical protein